MPAWHLFPISAGTKEPALPGDWRSHATSDPAQIEAWREAGYNLAVDLGASGLCALDPDGQDGEATLAGLGLDLPRTYTMRTPRGGRHLYYQGDLPNSVWRLGPHLDTRGSNGYVVWEGVIDARSGKPAAEWGEYVLLEDCGVAPLPPSIAPLVNARKDRKSANTDLLDTPPNVVRATKYLTALRPVTQGAGADARTYEVATALRDLGISEDRSIDLMLEHYNCQPQDDRFEAFIERKVRNAWAYGQNEEGAQAFDFDPKTRFQSFNSDALTAVIQDKPSKFKLWSVTEALLRPKPAFLFEGILPARSVGYAYGPPENGKTWLILDMALRLATGLGLDGSKENEPQDVIFFSGEGFDDLVHSRINAWCDYHGVSRELKHLHLLEGFPNVADNDDVDLLVEEIAKRGLHPRLIILDTYARVMAQAGLNENDPLDIMKFISQAEDLKRGFGCTVLAIHHSGKDLDRGARGSNALHGAVDFAYEITADWSVKALRLTCTKMKAAPRFAPLYYEALEHCESLVVRGITASTYHSLTRVEDTFGSRPVGSALAKLGATGQEHAVSAHVLASALYVAQIGEPEQEVQAKVDRIARKLAALGKGRLEHLCGAKGWSFPE